MVTCQGPVRLMLDALAIAGWLTHIQDLNCSLTCQLKLSTTSLVVISRPFVVVEAGNGVCAQCTPWRIFSIQTPCLGVSQLSAMVGIIESSRELGPAMGSYRLPPAGPLVQSAIINCSKSP